MSQPINFKEDTEKRPYGWDYDEETVASAVITITPAGLDKDGAEVIAGSVVYQTVKNGTPGVIYSMVFDVTTNQGNVYTDKTFVKVYST